MDAKLELGIGRGDGGGACALTASWNWTRPSSSCAYAPAPTPVPAPRPESALGPASSAAASLASTPLIFLLSLSALLGYHLVDVREIYTHGIEIRLQPSRRRRCAELNTQRYARGVRH